MTQIVDFHDIIAGTYGTLWLIRRTDDDNYEIRELKGVKGSFSNMATTKDGTIWLKDRNKATVYQAVMDGDSLRVIKVYNKDNGLPDDKFLKIYAEDHRRVIAMSEKGINEILNELKKDIADISAAEKSITLSLKRRLSDLNTKIDSNISTDNIFDKFEEQFNLLHNNFIKTLKSRYPDLSRNELMLCAYTIMELSTKEIAQLLNISVRGVETMRYRLKKKVIDDKNVDFGEFLKAMAK